MGGKALVSSEGDCVRHGRVRYPVLGGLGASEEEEGAVVDAVVWAQTNRSVMARRDVAR